VKFFSSQEWSLIESSVLKAEELAGEYFKITSFGPDKYVYEVVTLKDARAEEIEPGNFAHLIRYMRVKPGPGHSRKPERYYRILLQDVEILNCIGRHEADFGMDALLLYVLTHELIHVVRFERFQQAVEVEKEKREKEESAVHKITGEILLPIADAELRNVLAKYNVPSGDCFRVTDKTTGCLEE